MLTQFINKKDVLKLVIFIIVFFGYVISNIVMLNHILISIYTIEYIHSK
jgi:hypothetical protein